VLAADLLDLLAETVLYLYDRLPSWKAEEGRSVLDGTPGFGAAELLDRFALPFPAIRLDQSLAGDDI
jgi:hypothetical protein